MERVSPFTAEREGYLVSDDPGRLDVALIQRYLAEESYWAPGIPRSIVEDAIAHSLCLGLYATAQDGAPQVGFSRVITDYATFAYLCDVFVLPDHRGNGLGVWLTDCVLAHPALQGLRRFLLTTQTAHGVYEKSGFVLAPFPERFMVIDHPDLYRS